MKGKKHTKRLSALLISIVSVFSFSAVIASAAAFDPQTTLLISNNVSKDDYAYQQWATQATSFLTDTGEELMRVEYTNNLVYIEYYNAGFVRQSIKIIEPELPIWGGFYAGEDAYFLVYGQENLSESNSTEVVRVVKYDKNWNRLGSSSFYGGNTSVPFNAGAVSFAEDSGTLYIHTCHTMFKSSDGKNHQASMTLVVDEEKMKIIDSLHLVEMTPYGYTSHSFNQFILIDNEGRYVTLDHGDAYPRAIVINRNKRSKSTGKATGKKSTEVNVQVLPGNIGDNKTGAAVGGFAETKNSYVTAYNYRSINESGNQIVYLAFSDKKRFSESGTKIHSLTNGSYNPSTPFLVPDGLEGGYILWNDKSNNDLYWAYYANDGTVSAIHKAGTAALSDCQPVFINGTITWYTTAFSVPVFHQLSTEGELSETTATDSRLYSKWYYDGNSWYYFDANGLMVKNQWKLIGGKWYYFNWNGTMHVGMFYDSSYSYYLQSDGSLLVNGYTPWGTYADSQGRIH